MKNFINFESTSRLLSILYICIYALVGIIVYGLIMIKTKLLNQVLGDKFINNILKKLHLKR